MRKTVLILLLGIFLMVAGCTQSRNEIKVEGKQLSAVLGEMTDIMLHDVTSPPLGARFFGYACLSGYEILSENDSSYKSMYGILNDYPQIKVPDTIRGYSYQLAALLAVMEAASKLQPSGFQMAKYQKSFIDSIKKTGADEKVVDASLTYARFITKKILAYAKADGYFKISNFGRYTPSDKEGSWYPTPPAYMPAVEPYFNTIRSFTLDSNAQFKPEPPVAFSSQPGSPFIHQMLLNYNNGELFAEDKLLIAAYWDCNPFALQENGGHLQVGLKKISPGAHWLGITGIACAKAKKSFAETLKIHTLVSIALTDGFIACWDEKFRSNRIRPETAIRKYKDPKWKPLLQTPPFPEYPSGHSTISTAAAVILTDYFGDNFKYTDTVEVRFGLPSREFDSFNKAAEEAAMSRFYGGIHFMDGINHGKVQGARVGEWILKKVKLK